MTRSSLLLGATSFLLVACAALFEEPSQCATDADCARFSNSVCGADKICHRLESGQNGPGSISGGEAESTSSQANNPDGSTQPAPVAVNCPALGDRTRSPIPTTADADGGTTAAIEANLTLECAATHVLSGRVVIREGVTLTIEPGTQVEAEEGAALIVLPGAKLNAIATADHPIVFTSAGAKTSGAWRGVTVFGKAPPTGTQGAINYGGDLENDTSGSLEFVRVEYAARGLELMSIGSGTVVDGVQVRKTTDNCFTIAGGRVDVKHLVCQYPADEMFEFTTGYSGRAQYLVGQRTPTDGANHHGILVDDATVALSNATLCGADQTNLGNGLLLRNNAAPSFQNVVVRGFGAGFDVSGGRGTPFELRSSVFQGNVTENVAYEEGGSTDPASPLFDDDQGFDERAFFADAARKNIEENPGLDTCFDPGAPSFAPTTALAGEAPPSDGFFDTAAAHPGAVRDGANDWTKATWIRWSAE